MSHAEKILALRLIVLAIGVLLIGAVLGLEFLKEKRRGGRA